MARGRKPLFTLLYCDSTTPRGALLPPPLRGIYPPVIPFAVGRRRGDAGSDPPPQVAALQLQQSPVCTATVCRLPARTSTWRHCRRLRNRCRHWRRPWLHIHACGEEGNQGRNEGGGRNDLEVGRQQQQKQPIGAAGYAIEAEANGEHCTEHGAPVCHAKPCHAYINRMSIHKQDVYT